MLQWLPGADPATRKDGERLVERALELFKAHLSTFVLRKVTIAFAEVGGTKTAVVFHPKQKTAERLAGRLRKAGVAATGTSGDLHAEIALFEREPKVNAIGISNPKGPCSACQRYFANSPSGFANVYWDKDGWVR